MLSDGVTSISLSFTWLCSNVSPSLSLEFWSKYFLDISSLRGSECSMWPLEMLHHSHHIRFSEKVNQDAYCSSGF